MVGKYKVITLCGSVRFKADFMKAERDLIMEGHIVLSCGMINLVDGEYQTVLTEEVKEMLGDMHKRKIDMADEIFVINKEDYIGSSTRSEIEYATKTGKVVKFLEPHMDLKDCNLMQ